MDASVGRYAFGFTWGAWAAMFLATIFLFLGCGAGGNNSGRRKERRGSVINGGNTNDREISMFRRNRSKRSARGSFIDNESQRRVKDEYA